MGETEDERTAQASQLFENFVQASTCKGTLQAFSILCRQLELDPLDYSNFYNSLKAAVSSWKVKALWTKLDKRAQQKVYNQNKACKGTRVSTKAANRWCKSSFPCFVLVCLLFFPAPCVAKEVSLGMTSFFHLYNMIFTRQTILV